MNRSQISNGETILVQYKQSQLVLLPVLLLWLFVLITGFALFQLSPWSLLKWGMGIGFFVLSLHVVKKIWEWFRSYYSITTNRVLVELQNGWTERIVHEVLLQQITQSASTKSGLGYIFDYGDVILKTAAGGVPIVLKNVSNPDAIRGYIQELITVQV